MADKEWYEAICKQNVLRRFGNPKEVVGTAIFLAPDASSLILDAFDARCRLALVWRLA